MDIFVLYINFIINLLSSTKEEERKGGRKGGGEARGEVKGTEKFSGFNWDLWALDLLGDQFIRYINV